MNRTILLILVLLIIIIAVVAIPAILILSSTVGKNNLITNQG